MTGDKVVITGGAGFIGSQLGEALHQLGYRVLLLDDMSFGYEENLRNRGETFGTFIRCDIRSDELLDLFQDTRCVFHLAAISALPVCQSEPARAFNVNVGGTANVLEAARLAGVHRVVFASTSAVYENNETFPCSEEDPVDPNLVYAQTKLAAERLCLSYVSLYNLPVTVTRYFNVYGRNQDIKRKSPPFVAYVIRELLHQRVPVLHSSGEQKRDYVYIDDVNHLNMLCMTDNAAIGQIFNVASGRTYSVKEIYHRIAGLLETSIAAEFAESRQFWASYPCLFRGPYALNGDRVDAEVNKFTLGSTRKAGEILGWRAETDLEAGLRSAIAHARHLLRD